MAINVGMMWIMGLERVDIGDIGMEVVKRYGSNGSVRVSNKSNRVTWVRI